MIKKYKFLSYYIYDNIINEFIVIDINTFEKYPGISWNYSVLSQNHNLTINIVNKYPDKPWNWSFISKNPGITLEMIEKNIDKPWDWKYISSNPNLTINFIEKYIDKPWDASNLSSNKFDKNNIFIEKYGHYRQGDLKVSSLLFHVKKRRNDIKKILKKYIFIDLIDFMINFTYFN